MRRPARSNSIPPTDNRAYGARVRLLPTATFFRRSALSRTMAQPDGWLPPVDDTFIHHLTKDEKGLWGEGGHSMPIDGKLTWRGREAKRALMHLLESTTTSTSTSTTHTNALRGSSGSNTGNLHADSARSAGAARSSTPPRPLPPPPALHIELTRMSALQASGEVAPIESLTPRAEYPTPP